MKIDPASRAPPLLAVRDLELQLGSRRLVSGLTMTIQPGELWCVIGANGSGKTSLLHTMAGLRAPATGRVELLGRSLADWAPLEAARKRGLLPQTLHDAFGARVVEVVLAGRHPHLARWAWEGEAEVRIARDALSRVDLDGFSGRDVLTLSGGERQRVAIAALLAQDPALLLLDEGLAHLDLRHQISVLEHLAGLVRWGSKAVVLSVHDLNLAHRFATHVLLLGGSVTHRCGPTNDVMTPQNLSDAFGHRVTLVAAGDRTLFVPA